MNKFLLREQLTRFFQEDIGFGDRTSQSIFSDETSEAIYIAKEAGVFAGETVLKEGYALLQEDIELKLMKKDGEKVEVGDVIATVTGPTVELLSTERVLLNLVQRMSGIATLTNKAQDQLKGSKTNVCDTRKTTPGLRMLEKHAVVCGGGANHRLRLDDAIMIKDNHIAQSGSITEAVRRVKEKIGHMVKIEVETESIEEVIEAVAAGADVIMLDNCSVEEATERVKDIPDHIITEVSGGITLETIADYKHSGVDYISLGALTHSVKALDISLNIKVNGGTKYDSK
ncbi:carboxylating nicotinate-nucleotide diphosphorylase [Evansella cellulosilytica]|uniref:Probable nicotinate-nucleotide pyrophosphorylase [carboxylating] n=1 Tax=Evansella cellulosilytica (strain ATCC 21833 / DSM 2522 / FERM P-1141 / JCM 9156 / N-4) TaxID=649639 RepID=E6TUE4_EVAC2|nr:carboxylating nicotinate-nucleotide diphosphorylase [Evansella cellulosilytica]ADU29700.1 nicotinate-nucleotide pyrophosphorylase [Evansella cellulosilytica DSM 2522]